jgi:hypothetical protein
MEKLNRLGFDSVIIIKQDNENFKIDIMKIFLHRLHKRNRIKALRLQHRFGNMAA